MSGTGRGDQAMTEMARVGRDLPYTSETLRLVTEALASRKYSDSFEEDARHVLDELVEAGLLIPPRAREDLRWHARAYIYTRPDGKQLVLDPADVTVVLPTETT